MAYASTLRTMTHHGSETLTPASFALTGSERIFEISSLLNLTFIIEGESVKAVKRRRFQGQIYKFLTIC